MGQRLAGTGAKGEVTEWKGEGGRGWRVWRKTRMGAGRANPVRHYRAKGYRLGSFLENEPTAEKTMIRGRGGSNAQRLGKQMREGHG